jgi:hypothetical protein
LENTLTFVTIALLAVSAAIGGIYTHWEYSCLEKRSQNMMVALRELDERFSQNGTPEELKSLSERRRN